MKPSNTPTPETLGHLLTTGGTITLLMSQSLLSWGEPQTSYYADSKPAASNMALFLLADVQPRIRYYSQRKDLNIARLIESVGISKDGINYRLSGANFNQLLDAMAHYGTPDERMHPDIALIPVADAPHFRAKSARNPRQPFEKA